MRCENCESNNLVVVNSYEPQEGILVEEYRCENCEIEFEDVDYYLWDNSEGHL